MPKIQYDSLNFHAPTLELIRKCDAILTDYSERGWDGITLRQLFYQLVAKRIIPNTQVSYKLLGINMTNARMAGLIDWNHIIDRARQLKSRPNWSNPEQAISDAASCYHLPYWNEQDFRPEIWVEKDALTAVVEKAGNLMDVPFYACKGYNSVSQMWAAAQRFVEYEQQGKKPVVFYLGDHDPSGIDMSRDVLKRLTDFGAGNTRVVRIALNFEQIEELDPPPNPAKKGDTRYKDYKAFFKTSNCWELDAIDADDLVALITKEISKFLDVDLLEEVKSTEREHLHDLGLLAGNYNKAVGMLKEVML